MRGLNREDAMDHSRWMKQIRDDSSMQIAGLGTRGSGTCGTGTAVLGHAELGQFL